MVRRPCLLLIELLVPIGAILLILSGYNSELSNAPAAARSGGTIITIFFGPTEYPRRHRNCRPFNPRRG